MNESKAIGILGGTFDPIHNGHLYIAKTLMDELPLQHIRFIPCYQPVHRVPTSTSPEDRLTMLKLAVANDSHFIVDECEIKRKGPSYMIDTLQSLRKTFPTTPLCLILGTDSFQSITSWKEWLKLFDFAHFIIVNRPHYPLPTDPIIKELLSKKMIDNPTLLNTQLSGLILIHPIAPTSISASAIREAIQAKNDVSSYLPAAVLNYIHHHHLYQR